MLSCIEFSTYEVEQLASDDREEVCDCRNWIGRARDMDSKQTAIHGDFHRGNLFLRPASGTYTRFP